jgi:ABC-type nitrate/sulfonate/bicarbonate transport system substrate-binding protein
MHRRWLFVLVALILAGLAAWSVPGAAQQPVKIKFGMPTTPPNVVHITPWVAKDQGFFAEEGLDVEIPTFEGGIYVMRHVASGSLDVGAVPGAALAVSVARKAGLKAIYSPAPRFGSTMTVRSNIKTLADLKGKKVGIQEVGGFADILSKMVLRKAGIKPEEVTFVPIASADVPPLLAGAIDTAILHVDQVFTAQRKEPSLHVLVKFWELEPNQLYLTITAQEKKLAADPARYQKVVRALVKANRFMYANRARTVEIAAKHTQVDPAIVAETYDEFVRSRLWSQNDGLKREKIDYTINRMVQVGNIKPNEKPGHDDYVAVAVVQEALRGLPRVPDFD